MTAPKAGTYRAPGFWRATGERAIRTAAQTLVALVGTSATNLISGSMLDWLVASLCAAGLSVLTSIVAGIPEAPQGGAVGGPE